MSDAEIIERLARGEDPWEIDPEHGCANPLTGYYPSQEVYLRRLEIEEETKYVPRCSRCGRGTSSNSGLCSQCDPMMTTWP